MCIINAKKEFLENVKPLKNIRCAWISYDGEGHKPVDANLKENYTPEEFEEFISVLDFDYDHGYGIKKLSGCVWMNDGKWYKREEYDGSEWWECYSYPDVPEFLKREGE